MRSTGRALIAIVTALGAVVAFTGPGSSAASARPSGGGQGGLNPGAFVTYQQTVPVNVVLVGYDKSEVGAGLRSGLPASSEPLVRYPLLYGLEGRELGLRFNYSYNVIDTPASFENKFFHHLANVGVPGPLTSVQQDYNDQQANIRDVTGPVLTIDAPSTEQYLERAARTDLGIDQSKGYTVFLVNWFGRSDFAFHVYRKTDEVDTDTGFNFGAELDSRAMIAWGGTSGRSWFYDLSAGPESWTSNWDVDDADVDGDGEADYRMPPIWEYARGGYRSRAVLPSDLSKVVRYVALNLLFTSSPLYDPLNVAPQPGGDMRVHVTMFEDNPGSVGTDWINPASSVSEWSQLEPYLRWRADVRDVDPVPAGAKRALNIMGGLDTTKGCWSQFGDPFAQPFCYFDARRDKYLPPSGKDYVEGVFSYNTTDAALGDQVGLLGYADDNWTDGTQSYVFEFDTPEDRDAGFGFTTTTTHEVGHHLGLSHPHDGYDPNTGLDYDSIGATYYAWSGDESDTIMQYIAVSNGFGVFDQDNMSRYQFAGYLNLANALLGELGTHRVTAAQRHQLERADDLARQAQGEFRSWDYLAAAGHARQAWSLVRLVSDQEGVGADLAPSARAKLVNATVPAHEGDPIRFPNE
jgi:hypothetical protein